MCGMPQQPPVRSSPAAPRRAPGRLHVAADQRHGPQPRRRIRRGRGAAGEAGAPRPAAHACAAKLGLAAGLVLAALVVTRRGRAGAGGGADVAKERAGAHRPHPARDRRPPTSCRATSTRCGTTSSARQREALKKQRRRPGRAGGAAVRCDAGARARGEARRRRRQGGRPGRDGGPRESSGFSDTGRVRDRDMQRVVNGLWESGAEAISVNGQRLTALSAIRAAGDAILVDNKPLVPPYTVLAVGDGQAAEHRVPGQRRRPVPARPAGELRHPDQHLRPRTTSGCPPRRA